MKRGSREGSHARFVKYLFPKGQETWVKLSTIKDAGRGLFAGVNFQLGDPIAILGTTFNPVLGELYRWCAEVPWNDLHLDKYAGAAANSCCTTHVGLSERELARRKCKKNAAFQYVDVDYMNVDQPHSDSLVIVFAPENIQAGEEIFPYYNTDLLKPSRLAESDSEEEGVRVAPTAPAARAARVIRHGSESPSPSKGAPSEEEEEEEEDEEEEEEEEEEGSDA